MYKDGETVPINISNSPNRLLNCYRCKCKGSSIICGLMDCQFRFDCQSRFKTGECCPNYDHCDQQSTTLLTTIASTQQPIDNQTISQTPSIKIEETSNSSSDQATTLNKEDSVIESSSSNFSINEQVISITLETISSISNDLSMSTNTPTESESKHHQPISDEINKLNSDKETSNNDRMNSSLSSNELMITNNSFDDVKLSIQNATSSSNDVDEIVSNVNLQNKFTKSPSITSANDVTPFITNQVDQIDKRVDDFIIDDRIVDDKLINDKNRNEIVDNFASIPSSTDQPNTKINDSINQPLTTLQSILDSLIPNSTTIPTIKTDTTILAPNTNSIINLTTQSPLIDDESSTKKQQDIDESNRNSTIVKGKKSKKMKIFFNHLVSYLKSFG